MRLFAQTSTISTMRPSRRGLRPLAARGLFAMIRIARAAQVKIPSVVRRVHACGHVGRWEVLRQVPHAMRVYGAGCGGPFSMSGCLDIGYQPRSGSGSSDHRDCRSSQETASCQGLHPACRSCRSSSPAPARRNRLNAALRKSVTDRTHRPL
jgi:hypothetical protein